MRRMGLHFGVLPWLARRAVPHREPAHLRGADGSGHPEDSTAVRKSVNKFSRLGTTGRHGQGVFLYKEDGPKLGRSGRG